MQSQLQDLKDWANKKGKYDPTMQPKIQTALEKSEWIPGTDNNPKYPWHSPDYTKKLFLKENGDWKLYPNDGSGTQIDAGWGLQPLQHHLEDVTAIEQNLKDAGYIKVPGGVSGQHWYNDKPNDSNSVFLKDNGDWSTHKNGYITKGSGLMDLLPHIGKGGSNIENSLKAAGWEFSGLHPSGYDTWKKGKESIIIHKTGDWEYIDFGKKAPGVS